MWVILRLMLRPSGDGSEQFNELCKDVEDDFFNDDEGDIIEVDEHFDEVNDDGFDIEDERHGFEGGNE